MLVSTLAFALPDPAALGKIVVFLLMLSTLVVLHEAGHFAFARLFGVRVNDFAVGFGPTLLKWTSKRSGTNYRLNLLPIGGYCAMQGEDGKSTEAEQQRHYLADHPEAVARPAAPTGNVDNFQAKPPLQRLAIVSAGPLANFALAYAILFAAAVTFGVPTDKLTTVVGGLFHGSPAEKAGLKVGDRIVSVNGTVFANSDDIVAKIQGSIGKPLRLGFVRNGQLLETTVTPRGEKDQNGKLVGRIGFARFPDFQRVGFWQAFAVAGTDTYGTVAMQVQSLGMLLRHPAKYAPSLSGPIGMEQAAAATQDMGWGPYLTLAAAISVALGIFNFLPFPALDGGRAAFIVAEMLRGRPVEPEREALVHVTGLALLMCLMVFVAYHDIANIVSGKGVF